MASTGVLKRSLEGFDIFVPDPLPPKVILSSDVQRIVEEATYLLGQVEMSRTLLPNAELLIYSSLQREALASSTIEGTITSADELVRFQALHRADRTETREVANYGEALRCGFGELQERPLAGSLILGLHERLLQGVRGEANEGLYKQKQNYIGEHSDDPIDRAVFVPPGPSEVPGLITSFERYVNGENKEARVVQCALAHYQFETIHPFKDGNGRVGRLIIVLQMIQLGLLSAPLIYPSVYFERTRPTYYARLQAVRDRGEWNEWVGFFVEGIRQQAMETISFTHTILELRHRLLKQIANVSRRAFSECGPRRLLSTALPHFLKMLRRTRVWLATQHSRQLSCCKNKRFFTRSLVSAKEELTPVDPCWIRYLGLRRNLFETSNWLGVSSLQRSTVFLTSNH